MYHHSRIYSHDSYVNNTLATLRPRQQTVIHQEKVLSTNISYISPQSRRSVAVAPRRAKAARISIMYLEATHKAYYIFIHYAYNIAYTRPDQDRYNLLHILYIKAI